MAVKRFIIAIVIKLFFIYFVFTLDLFNKIVYYCFISLEVTPLFQ